MRFDKLQDIIDFAIAKEEEAIQFYFDLSTKVSSPEVSRELVKIMHMEERHRDWLQNYGLAVAASSEARQVQDMGISQSVESVPPGADMTFKEVLNLAMHREESAMHLYQELAKLVTDATVRQMFENLAAEECAHKLYFESIWDAEVLQEN
jgi:rubrerythrin